MQRLPDVTDAPAGWKALEALAKERADDEPRGARLALDIGANIGQAAKLLSPYFEHIVSFEPASESFGILAQEAPDNVTPCMVAVSDHPGEVALDVATEAIKCGQLVSFAASEGHPEWGKCINKRTVTSTTIDEWVGLNGIIPDLVKVDTEGHEYHILLGGYHTRVLAYTTWFIEVHSEELGDKINFLFPSHLYKPERIEHDIRQSKDHFYFVARPVGRG